MRTAEFIQRCMDAGMPLDMALTAAKAFDAEVEIAVDLTMEVRRAKERARQAKHRAKKAQASNADHVDNVASRDVTLEDVNPVAERDLTYVSAQVVTPSSSLRSEAYTPVSPNGLTAPRGAETARGTRLPESWTPDEAGWRYADETLGPVGVEPARELDRFRDYWRAVPGAKGRKSDWPATWRNWCRTAAERLPKPRNAHDRPNRHPAQPSASGRAAGRGVWAEILAEERGAGVGFGE